MILEKLRPRRVIECSGKILYFASQAEDSSHLIMPGRFIVDVESEQAKDDDVILLDFFVLTVESKEWLRNYPKKIPTAIPYCSNTMIELVS